MPNIVEKLSINHSPNFDSPKRNKKNIRYLIFHYTGMKNDILAINKLISPKSKVSCHYYIDKNGKIIQMVPDLYVAWHAGKSQWKKDKSINKYSLGIEISNPGHFYGYKKFNNNQISSLIKLSKYLIKKYKIKQNNILGHSDIAPLRKKDPGEKFPWKYLSKNRVGIWHNFKKIKRQKIYLDHNDLNKNIFLKKLNKFGYSIKYSNNNEFKKIVKNFQRRFRPKLIDGKIDNECIMIIKSLI
tara:strand:+ start:397 stop:1122 length:726 start_codon:yes stop_codon:yes gene_type:complete